MSLMAVCPKCGLNNSPMNTQCDVCHAPLLGGTLVDDTTAAASSWSWAATSLVITVAFYMPLWGLGVHPAILSMSMFCASQKS